MQDYEIQVDVEPEEMIGKVAGFLTLNKGVIEVHRKEEKLVAKYRAEERGEAKPISVNLKFIPEDS